MMDTTSTTKKPCRYRLTIFLLSVTYVPFAPLIVVIYEVEVDAHVREEGDVDEGVDDVDGERGKAPSWVR